MSTTVLRVLAPTLLLLLLTTNVQADCGCGSRCQKYTSELQCGRCCTATVRRSVPFQVAEPEEDNSIQEQLQETRRRSLAEISSIISLLEQKERRSPSKRVRTELHRTRQRLERYGKVRYGDLIDQQEQSTDKQFNEDEKEMYDVLERIIKRLVQKHTEDTTPVDKRSVDMLVEEPVRRTTEQRLAKLFRL